MSRASRWDADRPVRKTTPAHGEWCARGAYEEQRWFRMTSIKSRQSGGREKVPVTVEAKSAEQHHAGADAEDRDERAWLGLVVGKGGMRTLFGGACDRAAHCVCGGRTEPQRQYIISFCAIHESQCSFILGVAWLQQSGAWAETKSPGRAWRSPLSPPKRSGGPAQATGPPVTATRTDTRIEDIPCHQWCRARPTTLTVASERALDFAGGSRGRTLAPGRCSSTTSVLPTGVHRHFSANRGCATPRQRHPSSAEISG